MQQSNEHELDISDLSAFLARKAGIDLYGVGDVSVGLADELQHMPTAISLAVCNMNTVETRRGLDYYSYQHVKFDYCLENAQKLLVQFFKKRGYRVLAIPPDSCKMDERFISKLFPLFPHKTAATCAGLGWIGKNGLLINKEYGPCLSWATVLTNAPLRVSESPYHEGKCGKCRRCVDACPVGAVKDMEWVRGKVNHYHIDVEACMKHLEENKKQYGQPVCGLCVINCLRRRH